jgi:hypothetical protein
MKVIIQTEENDEPLWLKILSSVGLAMILGVIVFI